MDQVDKERFLKDHPYNNAIALDKTQFFKGYGEMLGEKSNLGYDQSKHLLYTEGNGDL